MVGILKDSGNLNHKLIYAAVLSTFLPYYITAIVIPVMAIFILINPKTRKGIFDFRGKLAFVSFTLLSMTTAVVYDNYFGLICSFYFVFMIIICQFVRKNITRRCFETSLNIACFAAVAVSAAAVVERLFMGSTKPDGMAYRCVTFFFNSNYMATMLGLVVVVCAYKVITRSGSLLMFYAIAMCCAVGIYLTGSMFEWIAVFIGVSALLVLCHQHQLLSAFLIITAVMFLLIALVPELLPRLGETTFTTENRVQIWRTAIDNIEISPIVGKGFFTYYHISGQIPGAYPTTHAHNLVIDSLLNFGIVGTAFGGWFFASYFSAVTRCHRLIKRSKISVLIIAGAAAIIFHSMIDLTILWIQTGLFVSVILGSIGIEERITANHHHTDVLDDNTDIVE